MIALIGMSGSGKSSVYNELLKRGYKPLVPLTTRERRDGEINRKDYLFVSKVAFFMALFNGSLIAHSKYRLFNKSVVYYGLPVPRQEQMLRGVTIINPHWINPLINYTKKVNIPLMICCISSSEIDREERLKQRGDNIQEITRRMKADEDEFAQTISNIECYSSYLNRNGELNKVVARIVNDYEQMLHSDWSDYL